VERFDKKTVIITGSSKGIGRGMAKVFASEGASVLVVSRHQEAGDKTVNEIRQAGGEASYFRADVSQWNDVEAMVNAAIHRYRKIDILCSNAAIIPSTPIETMPKEEWEDVLSVNLTGTFFAVKACFPAMKQRRYGRIVLTSSITGPYTGVPGWAHYGATKAGMLGFMHTAALEFAKHNVTINAILPGNIHTEETDEKGEEFIRSMEQAIPMGKLGDPEDIAYAALFLASDEAKYITGQTLIVDGGQLLPESGYGILT